MTLNAERLTGTHPPSFSSGAPADKFESIRARLAAAGHGVEIDEEQLRRIVPALDWEAAILEWEGNHPEPPKKRRRK